MLRWIMKCALVAVVWCSLHRVDARAVEDSSGGFHPLLLISLDAFRWDYCDLYPDQTPRLRQLKKTGASAKQLISVFPSNTFPNHYTIVTGLWPAHHGMINNTMFDPETGSFFRNTWPAAVANSRWWGGEPIWVTAHNQGLRTACSFWPGTEAAIKGVRPDFWKHYDYSVPFENRLEELVSWLRLPAEKRPSLVTFYLEETNGVGHTYGPGAPETIAAIQLLDTRVGVILDRLQSEGIKPNVIIVSDHGMTTILPERCVALDDFVDLTTTQIDFYGPVAGLRPLTGTVDQLMDRLKTLPAGAKAYRREELPERLHFTGNPRIPPVVILAAEGGWVATRQSIDPWLTKTKGEHGYDPQIESMKGTFIVHGPAFRNDGAVIDPVENVHMYNLLCAVLHLKPAPNDGDERLVKQVMRRDLGFGM